MKKLYRSKKDRKLCGICGGLAQYIDLDSTIIRLIVVVLSLCTAIVGAFLVYIIAALIIPEEPDYYDV